jgi:hypothetical protein
MRRTSRSRVGGGAERDEDEAHVGGGGLGCNRDEEAHASAAHVGEGLHHLGILGLVLEPVHELANAPVALADAVARGELHVHQDLGPIRLRHELLGRQREEPEAEKQQAHHRGEKDRTMAEEHLERSAIDNEDGLLVLGADLLLADLGRLQIAIAEDWSHRHGEQPRHAERDQDDLRHGAQVLARGVRRQRQRHEHQHRGDRRGEQRHRERAAGVDRGLDALFSLEEPFADLLRYHDAVVDEQPERDDERRQRDAVQCYVEVEHRAERHDHRQRDVKPHDGSGAQAQEAHDHDEDDADGLEEIGADRRHRALYVGGLVVAHAQLESDRKLLLELLEALHHARSHVEHVLALGHADADEDGLLAVVVERGRGRIDVPAPHGGDVPELDDLSRVGDLDGNGLDVLDASEVTVRIHDDLALPGVDAAPRKNDVLRNQRFANRGHRESQLREPRGGELDPDRLALDAVEIHALHGGDHVEVVLDPLRHLVHLRQAEAGTGERRAHHRDAWRR